MRYQVTQLITSHSVGQTNKIIFIATCLESVSIIAKKVTCKAEIHHDEELLGSTITITEDDKVIDNRSRRLSLFSIHTHKALPFESDPSLLLDAFKKA